MNDYRHRFNRATNRAANSVIKWAADNPPRALQAANNLYVGANLAGLSAVERAARNTVYYAGKAYAESNPRQPFHRVKSFLKSEMAPTKKKGRKRKIAWVAKPSTSGRAKASGTGFIKKLPEYDNWVDQYAKPRLRTTAGGTVIGMTYGSDAMPRGNSTVPPTPRRNSTSMDVDQPTELQQWYNTNLQAGRRGTPHAASGQIAGTVSKQYVKVRKTRKRKGKKRQPRKYYSGNCHAGAVIKKENYYATNATDHGKQSTYISVGAPILYIRKVMAYALVKKCFTELYDIVLEDWKDKIPAAGFNVSGATTGTGTVGNFGIEYTRQYDTAATPQYVQVNFTIQGATPDTWEQLADRFRLALDTAVYASTDRMVFTKVYIQPNGSFPLAFPSKSYPFKSVMFKGFWSMRFALQNATNSSDGSSLNATDNVLTNPVEYELFKGKGNGPLIKLPKRGVYTTLVADNLTCYNTHNPNNTPNPTPPPDVVGPGSLQDILCDGCTAKDFYNAKKAGKGVISPGAIKDFFWKDQISSSFMILYSKLCGRSSNDQQYSPFGTYLMTAIDKIVTKTNDTNIQIKFEITLETGGIVLMKKASITNPIVVSS